MKLTIVGIASAAVALFIATTVFMLGIGAVHHWIPLVPTVGFDDALAITVTGYIFLSMLELTHLFVELEDYPSRRR